MDAKFKSALKEICSGNDAAALVTIINTKGSSPRKPGAKMVILPDGRVFGTIGGGCGEAEVRREALNALSGTTSATYIVNMTNDMAEEEGMVCGGIMEVLINVIPPGANPEKELLTSYLNSLESGEEPVLATITNPGEVGRLGRKLFLTADGKRHGDLGNDKLNEVVTQWTEHVRSISKIHTVTIPADSGEPEYTLLLEPSPAPVELLILGGGHIAQPLAAMANIVGYRVTVVDDRPAFANTERFPSAKVICEDFVRALREQIRISPTTFIVIVTRGHRHDKLCLREVISQPAAYIGMIGSRRRVKALLSELSEEGIPEVALDRIYSPIGLDIEAETPEEIAAGIIAELIKVHRGGRAESLKISSHS